MNMHDAVGIRTLAGCAIGVGLLAFSPLPVMAADSVRHLELDVTHMLAAQGKTEVATMPPGFVPFGKMEKAAFLGVATHPVDDSLSRQLGLVKGTGLLVKHVDPNSPADGKIEVHDVLRTFDGQVLVNQEQLAVLVRTNKPGSTVSIELTRAAKPVTVTVKLSEKEMPALIRSSTGNVLDPHMLQFLGGTNSPVRIQMRRYSDGDSSFVIPGFGASSKTVTSHFNGRTGTTTMNTDNHTFTLTTDGGSKTLRVTTRDGKEVFNGPVNTDDDRAKIPASFRDGLKELDNITIDVEVSPQAE